MKKSFFSSVAEPPRKPRKKSTRSKAAHEVAPTPPPPPPRISRYRDFMDPIEPGPFGIRHGTTGWHKERHYAEPQRLIYNCRWGIAGWYTNHAYAELKRYRGRISVSPLFAFGHINRDHYIERDPQRDPGDLYQYGMFRPYERFGRI